MSDSRTYIHLTRNYELSAALRRIRLDAGLTQAELAERASTSRQWVSAAENGRLPHGIDLLLRLLHELGYRLHFAPAPEAEFDLQAHVASFASPIEPVRTAVTEP